MSERLQDAEKVFSIGRAGTCDVVIRDLSISRHHATIRFFKDNQIVISDENSENGTFLVAGQQNKKIKNQTVKTSDLIVFGSYKKTMSDLLAEIEQLELNRKDDSPIEGKPPLPELPEGKLRFDKHGNLVPRES